MALDQELNKKFLSRVKKEPKLKEDQVSWIRSRRAKCGRENLEKSAQVACLEFEYRRRIDLLNDSGRPQEVDKSVTLGAIGKIVLRQSYSVGSEELHCLNYVDFYLPEQIVPQQTISPKTCTYGSGPFYFVRLVEDFNFDGYPDLRIWNAEASGATNHSYFVYLFDPQKRQFFEEPTFPDGGFPEIDKEKKLLLTHSNGGHAGLIGSNESYRYVNGKYIKADTEHREWVPDYCCYNSELELDQEKQGCLLVDECNKENPVLPQCHQYLIKRQVFDEKGALVKSEEEVSDGNNDTKLNTVGAKVNCSVK